MAGKNSHSDRTRSYKTTTASTGGSSTRRFPTAKTGRPRATLAREKQRRQYEQQKREKLIFAMFVVIILVMILFAILIFKKIVDNTPANPNDSSDPATTTGPENSDVGKHLPTFKAEMVTKDRLYQGSLVYITGKETSLDPADVLDLKTVPNPQFVIGLGGSHLELAAGNAFVTMAADCHKATGYTLNVQTAYDPGDKGEFSTGLLLDISLSLNGKTYLISDYDEVFEWFESNAAKYGFIMRKPERTHYCFRYVGVPHAYYMEENSLDLPAYLELLRTAHDLSGATGSSAATSALKVKADGISYEVYYVKSAGGDMTEVPIPSYAVSYTVSGDNMGGFVVTAVTE